MLVRSGAVDVIIVDSVVALTPKRKSKAKWVTLPRASRHDDEPGVV
ncbi:hypothetical protein ACNKHQ_15650 [Shigella flexneri]